MKLFSSTLILLLAMTLYLTAIPASLAGAQSRATVNNYEECVKAGYPKGTFDVQRLERCWTPDLQMILVNGPKPTIKQGVYGTVTLRYGNCTPRIHFGDERDRIPSPNPCGETTVDTEVYVIKPIATDWNEAIGMGKWKDGYLTEEAIPIKMQVAKNGFYEFDLPVGTYNVFVQDNGKKYCVGICWITIKRDEIKENNIRINHASD